MSEHHTKEPWQILDEGDLLEIFNGKEGVISAVFDYSNDPEREKVLRNFRRIVACVNACAGISTENLETLSVKPSLTAMVGEYKQQRDDLQATLNTEMFDHAATKQQRDELLDALKAQEELSKVGLLNAAPGQIERVNKKRREAIAKAEASK